MPEPTYQPALPLFAMPVYCTACRAYVGEADAEDLAELLAAHDCADPTRWAA